jgi:hypothetical protein
MVEANLNALLEHALEPGANDMIEPTPDVAAPPLLHSSGTPAPSAPAAAEATA